MERNCVIWGIPDVTPITVGFLRFLFYVIFLYSYKELFAIVRFLRNYMPVLYI